MKDNRTLKVFISCTLGTGLGTMIALNVTPFLWWIGPIVGGLVGYLSYEFKVVMKTVSDACSNTIAWRPDGEFWRLLGKSYVGTVLVSITLIVPMFFASVILPSEEVKHTFVLYMIQITAMTIFLPLWAALTGGEKEGKEELKKLIEDAKMLAPQSVYLYGLPKGIVWCVKKAPDGLAISWTFIKNCGNIIKQVSVTIHSDIRLLCGCDAMIGAVLGYFAGSVIIGMIAGGLLGVLNYEIVSKRILHRHETQ